MCWELYREVYTVIFVTGITNTPNPNPSMKTRDVAPELRPFWKLFEPLAYRHDYSRVFDDFLSIALTQFAEPDDEVMIKLNNDSRLKYTADERHQFGLMFQEMIRTLHRHLGDGTSEQLKQEAQQALLHQDVPARKGRCMEWYDFFGDFYQELSSRSKASAMGQFFTPPELCNLIARMTMGDQVEGKGGKNVNEPCAGSGRMVLALNAIEPGNFYVAQDLDFMCCKMTALNMLLHGCVGEVTWGNSLDPEDIRTTFAVNPFLNDSRHRYRGIPHVLPVEPKQSFLHGFWQQRLAELNARKNPAPKVRLTLY